MTILILLSIYTLCNTLDISNLIAEAALYEGNSYPGVPVLLF